MFYNACKEYSENWMKNIDFAIGFVDFAIDFLKMNLKTPRSTSLRSPSKCAGNLFRERRRFCGICTFEGT